MQEPNQSSNPQQDKGKQVDAGSSSGSGSSSKKYPHWSASIAGIQGTSVQGAVSLGFVLSAKDWIMYQRIAQMEEADYYCSVPGEC